jgi:hypothetical protein
MSTVDGGEEEGPRVFKIVLTGGPCGGKTTALARLSDFFRKYGECKNQSRSPSKQYRVVMKSLRRRECRVPCVYHP